MSFPWSDLNSWAPFHIDALGLVTLLGADNVDACIGRLVPSRWLEYLPLLGGFVVAGDMFRTKEPAFQVCNMSDGIKTSDLASWFTRWINAQDFDKTRSVVFWDIRAESRTWWPYMLAAAVISFVLNGILIAMTILAEDWYGLANAIAMVVSIIVRAYLLDSNRRAINRVVKASVQPKNAHDWAKTIVITSDSRCITMLIPKDLVVPIFVHNSRPKRPHIYTLIRAVGWVFFAVHIIAIGSACLATQIYSVALLVIPTVLICWGCGCDDSRLQRSMAQFGSNVDVFTPYSCWLGTHLRATVFEWPLQDEFVKVEPESMWSFRRDTDPVERSERRQDLYAWLKLSIEEEASLRDWDLLPRDDGNEAGGWWSDYNAKKALVLRGRLDIRERAKIWNTDFKLEGKMLFCSS